VRNHYLCKKHREEKEGEDREWATPTFFGEFARLLRSYGPFKQWDVIDRACCRTDLRSGVRETVAMQLLKIVRIRKFYYRAIALNGVYGVNRYRSDMHQGREYTGWGLCECGRWVELIRESDRDVRAGNLNPPLVRRTFASASEADRFAERRTAGLPVGFWFYFVAGLVGVGALVSGAIPGPIWDKLLGT